MGMNILTMTMAKHYLVMDIMVDNGAIWWKLSVAV